MERFLLSPREMFVSFYRNKTLIYTLIKREVVSRYRGSLLGIIWSFFNPILLLMIYTFVFSVVFKARWGGGSDSKTEFALILFSGLIIFNLFSECITKAPTLIIVNANYVKKMRFPLEVLPWAALGTALFQTLINLIVWLLFYIVIFGTPHATVWLVPIIITPILFFIIGLSWFLASLGVYLRDINQLVAIGTTILMFLSPIFYPLSSIPVKYRHFIQLNPLTPIVEGLRDVLFWGTLPSIKMYVIYSISSIVAAWLGFFWFQKSRTGFADVL